MPKEGNDGLGRDLPFVPDNDAYTFLSMRVPPFHGGRASVCEPIAEADVRDIEGAGDCARSL